MLPTVSLHATKSEFGYWKKKLGKPIRHHTKSREIDKFLVSFGRFWTCIHWKWGDATWKTEWFRERFRGFRAPDNGFGGGRMVHGRPDKRAILVDLVHASGTTKIVRGRLFFSFWKSVRIYSARMGPFWSEFIPPESELNFCQDHAIPPEYFLVDVIIRSDQNMWLPFDIFGLIHNY